MGLWTPKYANVEIGGTEKALKHIADVRSERYEQPAPLHDQLAGQGHHAQSVGKTAESHRPHNGSINVIAPLALTSMTKTANL